MHYRWDVIRVYLQNSLIRKSPILCGSVLLNVMLPSVLTISFVGICDRQRMLPLCSSVLKIRKPIKSLYAATYVVHKLEKDVSFRHSANRFLVLKWSAYPTVPDTQNSKQKITRISGIFQTSFLLESLQFLDCIRCKTIQAFFNLFL